MKACKEYIEVLSDVQSELCVPLTANDRKIGVISVSSHKLIFFNRIHAMLLVNIGERITERYLEKIRTDALNKLALPYNIFADTTNEIYKEIRLSPRKLF